MLFNSPTQFAVLGLLLFVGWLFGFASHPGGKRWRKAYEEEAVGRATDRDELDQQLRQVDARVAELEREKADLAAQLAEARAARPAVSAPVAGAAGIAAASAARPAFAEPVPAPAPAYSPDPAPQPAHAAAPLVTPGHAEAVHAAPEHAAPEHAAPGDAAPAARSADPVPAAAAAAAAETAPQPEPQPEPEPVRRGWFDWGKSDDLSKLRGVDAELQRKLKDEKIDTFREIADLSDQDEIALERRLDLPAGYIQREEWRQQARMLADGNTAGHAEAFAPRGEPVRPLPLG